MTVSFIKATTCIQKSQETIRKQIAKAAKFGLLKVISSYTVDFAACDLQECYQFVNENPPYKNAVVTKSSGGYYEVRWYNPNKILPLF